MFMIAADTGKLMNDQLLKSKIAALEKDILDVARAERNKQKGYIDVSIEEKIKLAAALKRLLLDRQRAAGTL